MPENDEHEQIEAVGKNLKKKYMNSDSIPAVFTNDMTINHNNREFFISFWRTEQPLFMDIDEFSNLEEVDTVLVSKLVLTPEFAKAVLKAMGNNIENFDKVQLKDGKE